MNYKEHIKNIKKYGYTKISNLYDNTLIENVIEDYYIIKKKHQIIKDNKNMDRNINDVSFHTIIDSKSHLELFEKKIIEDILTQYFDGLFILNTTSITELVPETKIYTKAIHRDIRSFQGASALWMQMIILFSDSTKKNGATWLLPPEKNTVTKPKEKYFWENAVQVEAAKGDVMFFDPNLWHCSGSNNSNQTRLIMTPIFSKPFIKQQFDYPRAFGNEFPSKNSKYLSQILGYNARTPETLDQFYQKNPEDRFYKTNQG